VKIYILIITKSFDSFHIESCSSSVFQFSLTPKTVVLPDSGVPLVVVVDVAPVSGVSGVSTSDHDAVVGVVAPGVGVGQVPVFNVEGMVRPLRASHPVSGSSHAVDVLGAAGPDGVHPLDLVVPVAHVSVVEVEFPVSLGGVAVAEVGVLGDGPDGRVVEVNSPGVPGLLGISQFLVPQVLIVSSLDLLSTSHSLLVQLEEVSEVIVMPSADFVDIIGPSTTGSMTAVSGTSVLA